MALETTCYHCSTDFDEGNLALKTDEGYVHYADARDISKLMRLFPCDAKYSGKVCVYHNEKFYDLEKHVEHLTGVNVNIDIVKDLEGHPKGQTIFVDLSFFDKLEPEN